MDHFEHIYTHRAADYHEMIAAEDVDDQLLPALQRITPLQGKRVLDLGTGTGRLPLLIGNRAAQVVGLDLHWDMLRQNLIQRRIADGAWELVEGDMRALPFRNACADIVIAGWAIGHLQAWFAGDWQVQIGRVLTEMHRVVAPGGTLIVIETLSTGSLTPAPPTEALADYYTWLEQAWAFARQTVHTDFCFADVGTAIARTEFFFGAELAAQIQEHGWARLPEWTGIWSKQV